MSLLWGLFVCLFIWFCLFFVCCFGVLGDYSNFLNHFVDKVDNSHFSGQLLLCNGQNTNPMINFI